MKIITEEKEGCMLLQIEDAVTIYETRDLRESLLKGFEKKSKGVLLDLLGVTEIDTAALQLLCSARHTADARGKRFAATGISEAVRRAMDAVGLTAGRIFDAEEEVS